LLLPTLTQCAALTHLDLSDNNVTAEGVEALVTVLLPESRLRDLRLANNWFGPAGVYALTVVLEANMGLRHIDVSNKGAPPKDASRCDSDQHALRALADALRVSCYNMYFLFVTLLFYFLLLFVLECLLSFSFSSSSSSFCLRFLIRFIQLLLLLFSYWCLLKCFPFFSFPKNQIKVYKESFMFRTDQHGAARPRHFVFGRDARRPVCGGAGAHAALQSHLGVISH
jgi:hypothetical protein